MNLHEILLASKIVRKNGSDSADLSDYYTKSQTDSRISEKVAEIIANAPDDFDTLKEISDWIADYEDSAAAMNTAIATNTAVIADKVDKVSGKGLSTNDFTNADKSKLDGLENYDDTDIKADISNVQEQIDSITNQIFGAGTAIPNGADLNDYTQTGVYYCINAAASATLLNNPHKDRGFRLEIVKTTIDENRVTQKLYPNDSKIGIFYMRMYDGYGMGNWYKFSGEVATTT